MPTAFTSRIFACGFLLLAVIANAAGSRGSSAKLSQKTYEYIISGAGPGGLTTALELVEAGVDPAKILVIEERPPASSERIDGAKNPHGSRGRMIILDAATVAQLRRLGVKVPGQKLGRLYFVRGTAIDYIENEGIWKAGVASAMSRDFSHAAVIGDLEKNLLERAQELGIPVLFSSTAEIENKSNGISAAIRGPGINKTVRAKQAVIAEGKKSANRENLGIQYNPIKEGVDQPVVTMDFRFTMPARVGGRQYLFFDNSGNLQGMAFVTSSGGSIGFMAPSLDVVKNPRERAKYVRLAEETLDQLGFKGRPELTEPTSFTGTLAQADKVSVGRIHIIGDASRSTAPTSANGVNTAMRDAGAVGRFERARASGKRGAKRALVTDIVEDTRYSVEGSLYFQALYSWISANWGKFQSTMSAAMMDEPMMKPIRLPWGNGSETIQDERTARRPRGMGFLDFTGGLLMEVGASLANAVPGMKDFAAGVAMRIVDSNGIPRPYDGSTPIYTKKIPIHPKEMNCVRTVFEAIESSGK